MHESLEAAVAALQNGDRKRAHKEFDRFAFKALPKAQVSDEDVVSALNLIGECANLDPPFRMSSDPARNIQYEITNRQRDRYPEGAGNHRGNAAGSTPAPRGARSSSAR